MAIFVFFVTIFVGLFGAGIFGNLLRWPGAGAVFAIATVGAQIIELARTVAAQPNGEPTSPFISLAVTAILYAVFLGWFRHKYGG